MAVSVTLQSVGDRLGFGVTAAAHLRSHWPSSKWPSGAPSGSPATTATVDATTGNVTFTGLAEHTDYVAYVSGQPVIAFSTKGSTRVGLIDTSGASDGQVVGYEGASGTLTLRSVDSDARLAMYAANPDQLTFGAITRDANGAATSASVTWPDGATGTFTGTASTTLPGAVDSYTITHVSGGTTKTFTQPAVTRDSTGAVATKPAITVS